MHGPWGGGGSSLGVTAPPLVLAAQAVKLEDCEGTQRLALPLAPCCGSGETCSLVRQLAGVLTARSSLLFACAAGCEVGGFRGVHAQGPAGEGAAGAARPAGAGAQLNWPGCDGGGPGIGLRQVQLPCSYHAVIMQLPCSYHAVSMLPPPLLATSSTQGGTRAAIFPSLRGVYLWGRLFVNLIEDSLWATHNRGWLVGCLSRGVGSSWVI